MRLNPISTAIVAAALLAASACSREPQPGSAAANADAMADQLEAKADNYGMLADNTTDSETVDAFENAASTLDTESANLRAEASPKDTVR